MKQADEDFYSMFYIEFFKKFNSYNELPDSWRKDKEILANFIFEHIKNKQKVLSVGSGNGFIENELSKKWGKELVAIEPSKTSSKWLKKNEKIKLINGYFPDCLHSTDKFDFAYMSYIDYVFDDNMYVNMLKDIKEYPINDFLLIGASVYTPNFKESIKYLIKNLLSFIGLYNQQRWGYQRTVMEHLAIFKKAGYKNIEYGKLENGTYWIRAKNE
ncbi:MAG: hypothetical protein ACNI3C_02130 [Candidatus Marinarcus sp.]|uniref:hypothetical protein n=1 Tax=Candidatus Marinarcus sp. TaxID=3100987 RepID=UPI003B0081E1